MVTKAFDKLILALDLPESDKALGWVKRFKEKVHVFKVGLELFTASGPDVVRGIVSQGPGVFLDLKLHDIPNTVGHAVKMAGKLGAKFLTVHALGGRAMMEAAAKSAAEFPDMTLLAVTVLTHLSDDDLNEMGFDHTASGQAVTLARLAEQAGLHGLVCSPLEAAYARQFLGADFKIVTPGIRCANASADDQHRVASPGEALKNGADWLVVGRPVLQAEDPDAALDKILEECQGALPAGNN